MDINSLLNKNLQELCSIADKVRKDNVGDIIHIRALLEISNICYRNCAYCGLNIANNHLERYAMNTNEIETLGKRACDIGYKTIVLQSGESKHYNINELADCVVKLSEYGLTVTLSLGELDYKQLQLLKSAGAKRYLLKFETADKTLYEKLHNGYTLDNRLECLQAIRELGYELGSGFLVGLPNENDESIVKNLQLIQKLRCDMVGIGVFIPHKYTPLADLPCGDTELTKKCVAITRILLPNCNIPITTSLGEFGDKYQMFNGGANVIMQNITPHNLAKNYQIYPKKLELMEFESARKQLESDIVKMCKKPL